MKANSTKSMNNINDPLGNNFHLQYGKSHDYSTHPRIL